MHSYLGLGFSESGDELFGLLKTRGRSPATWSLTTGLPTGVAPLAMPQLPGPPLPGPEPHTIVVPFWGFDDGYVVKNLMTPKGRPFSTAAVVDARTGKMLALIASLVLRRDGTGFLALSSLKFNPDLPLPPGSKLEQLSDYDKQRLLETRVIHVEKFDDELIGSEVAAQSTELLPPARPGDRTGLVAATPNPPQAWNPF